MLQRLTQRVIDQLSLERVALALFASAVTLVAATMAFAGKVDTGLSEDGSRDCKTKAGAPQL